MVWLLLSIRAASLRVNLTQTLPLSRPDPSSSPNHPLRSQGLLTWLPRTLRGEGLDPRLEGSRTPDVTVSLSLCSHASPYAPRAFGMSVKFRRVPSIFPLSRGSTLAWKIPWMEEPGGLQSMGLQRVGHD